METSKNRFYISPRISNHGFYISQISSFPFFVLNFSPFSIFPIHAPNFVFWNFHFRLFWFFISLFFIFLSYLFLISSHLKKKEYLKSWFFFGQRKFIQRDTFILRVTRGMTVLSSWKLEWKNGPNKIFSINKSKLSYLLQKFILGCQSKSSRSIFLWMVGNSSLWNIVIYDIQKIYI